MVQIYRSSNILQLLNKVVVMAHWFTIFLWRHNFSTFFREQWANSHHQDNRYETIPQLLQKEKIARCHNNTSALQRPRPCQDMTSDWESPCIPPRQEQEGQQTRGSRQTIRHGYKQAKQRAERSVAESQDEPPAARTNKQAWKMDGHADSRVTADETVCRAFAVEVK